MPYTVEEMVREAKSAYEAGAAILHIHVREDDGTPTQGRERFRVVMDAIRKELPDVIMIPSTGGAAGMTPEERLQPTELFPDMRRLSPCITAAAAIAMGGNVRVGFEDNIYLGKGQKAASNGELVAKVVRIAKELGREIATPAEAREILSLKPLK